MKGKPGAWVEMNGTIMPDANDQAMSQRIHVGGPIGKPRKIKKAGGKHVPKK